MASALAQGWIGAGLTTPDQICACDPVAAARDQFKKATGAAAGSDYQSVIAQSNVVVLAVKPQNMAELLRDIRPGSMKPRHLVVSIAAGITLQQIADALGADKTDHSRHAEHAVPGRGQRVGVRRLGAGHARTTSS